MFFFFTIFSSCNSIDCSLNAASLHIKAKNGKVVFKPHGLVWSEKFINFTIGYKRCLCIFVHKTSKWYKKWTDVTIGSVTTLSISLHHKLWEYLIELFNVHYNDYGFEDEIASFNFTFCLYLPNSSIIVCLMKPRLGNSGFTVCFGSNTETLK